MALKIRLRQQGRKNRRMYRIVVADERLKRDGKYLEALGWYNPHEEALDKKLFVDATKTEEWLSKGAQLTESSRALVAKAAPELMQRVIKKEEERRNKIRLKRKAARKRCSEKREANKAAKPAAKKAAPKAKAEVKAEVKKPAAKKPAAKKVAPKAKAEVKAEPKTDAAEKSAE